MPWGPKLGDHWIRDSMNSIEQLGIGDDEKAKIFEGNARKLLHL
jgi:predicted TIM-barrel fold metal-dependent hydrolase